MAHFFFHFCDGDSRSRDELGLELDTAEQAYLEAFAAAKSMWPELLGARCNPLDCAFEVTDAHDALLFRLPFAELVEVCRPPRAPRPEFRSAPGDRGDPRASADGQGGRTQRLRQSARSWLQEANNLLGRLATFERGRLGSQAGVFGGTAAR